MSQVVIIGGGPAGLATAAYLADRAVPCTLLERGERAFAALRALDPEMQLLTPPRFSRLPRMTARPGAPRYERFGEIVKHFEAWRVEHGLEVMTGCTVETITPVGDRLAVTYRRGGATESILGTHVVNATGMIGHPVLPASFDPSHYGGTWQHSLTVRTPDLAAARRLVVVGAGTSAAEVIERWLAVRDPDARAWLSTRAPVVAAPHQILGIDIHWFLWAPELAPGRVFGRRIGLARDLIIGREILRALEDGAVTRVPAPTGYAGSAVILADETTLEPDLLVLATGYRYAVDHLGPLVALDDRGHPTVDRHSASTRTPNLYVLGVRFGRSVASSTLRGITRDAAHVARRIARTA